MHSYFHLMRLDKPIGIFFIAMAYILGISVPAEVSIGMALQRIKGISTTIAKWLCAATNVGFFLPVEQVNQYQLNEL